MLTASASHSFTSSAGESGAAQIKHSATCSVPMPAYKPRNGWKYSNRPMTASASPRKTSGSPPWGLFWRAAEGDAGAAHSRSERYQTHRIVALSGRETLAKRPLPAQARTRRAAPAHAPVLAKFHGPLILLQENTFLASSRTEIR